MGGHKKKGCTFLEAIMPPAKFGKVVTVAKSGGDYLTVYDGMQAVAALAPSSINPILLLIYPGIYTETQQINVPKFTTIAGFGRYATVIQNSAVGYPFYLPSDDAPGENWDIAFSSLSIYGTHAIGQAIMCSIATDTYKKNLYVTECHLYGKIDSIHTTGLNSSNFNVTCNSSNIESDGDAFTLLSGVTGGTIGKTILNNCTIRSLANYDTGFSCGVRTGPRHKIYLNNCTVEVVSTDGDTIAVYGVRGSTIAIMGGSITVTNSNGTGPTYGVEGLPIVVGCKINVTAISNSGNVFGVSGSSSAGKVIACDIETTKDSGNAYDLHCTTGSIDTIGTKYDRTKISGNVRDITKSMSYTKTEADTPVTLTALDSEKIFKNTGAAGTVKFDLPVSVPGIEYTFVIDAVQQLQIDPNGTETIAIAGVQQGAGKYIWADAVGEQCKIRCVKAGQWEQLDALGTWTAEV